MTDNDTPNRENTPPQKPVSQNPEGDWSNSALPPGFYQISTQADSLHFQMMSPSCSGTNTNIENVKQAGDNPQANA